MVGRNQEYVTPSGPTTRGEDNQPQYGNDIDTEMPVKGPHFEKQGFLDSDVDKLINEVEDLPDQQPAVYVGESRYSAPEKAAEALGLEVDTLVQFLPHIDSELNYSNI